MFLYKKDSGAPNRAPVFRDIARVCCSGYWNPVGNRGMSHSHLSSANIFAGIHPLGASALQMGPIYVAKKIFLLFVLAPKGLQLQESTCKPRHFSPLLHFTVVPLFCYLKPVGYLRMLRLLSASPGQAQAAAGAGHIFSEFFIEKLFRHRISYSLLFNVFFLNGSILLPLRQLCFLLYSSIFHLSILFP